MAIQLALGAAVPWLAATLGAFIIKLLEFFGNYLTRRFAIAATALTIVFGLMTTFGLAIYGLIQGITVTAPDEFAIAAGLFLPSNTYACAGAALTAKTLAHVYQLNATAILYKMRS